MVALFPFDATSVFLHPREEGVPPPSHSLPSHFIQLVGREILGILTAAAQSTAALTKLQYRAAVAGVASDQNDRWTTGGNNEAGIA